MSTVSLFHKTRAANDGRFANRNTSERYIQAVTLKLRKWEFSWYLARSDQKHNNVVAKGALRNLLSSDAGGTVRVLQLIETTTFNDPT